MSPVLFSKHIHDIENFMIERNGSGITSITNDAEAYSLDMGFWSAFVRGGADQKDLASENEWAASLL